jgi:uncharacterized oxidoreductase
MKQYHHIKDPQAASLGSFSFPGKVIKRQGAAGGSAGMAEGKTALLAGSYVMKTFGPEIKGGRGLENIMFSGECSPGEFFRVKTLLLEKSIKTLIAAGGGKTLDLAKYIKRDIPGLKLINIPTSAATCAAYTPITVLYDERGVYMDTLDTACPDIIILDYRIFDALPMPFFAAGAVDTLAKYYESAVFTGNSADKDSYDVFICETARQVYMKLKKLIMKKWAKPGAGLRRELAEINIIDSGIISCLGRFSVTSGIAHAAAHALTLSEGARRFLHGEHVAAGLVIQEIYLNNKAMLGEVEALSAVMDVPARLSGLGVRQEEIPDIAAFYKKIISREKIFVPERAGLMYNIFKANF